MIIHSAYGERAKTIKYIPGKSRTKQSMKDETNINFIIDQYNKTGSLEHLKKYEGQYAQFDSIDFHTAMNVVVEAEQMFDELPSSIRSKFQNDPGQFLDYATNKENHEGMVEMGLAHTIAPTAEQELLQATIELSETLNKAEEPPADPITT